MLRHYLPRRIRCPVAAFGSKKSHKTEWDRQYPWLQRRRWLAFEVGRPGYLIAHWTNGRLRLSPEPVVNPTGPAAINQRYFFVLVHRPNPDAAISFLEPCQGQGILPKFAPITAGEHLRARAEASRRYGYRTALRFGDWRWRL